jgi:hypothetical protein
LIKGSKSGDLIRSSGEPRSAESNWRRLEPGRGTVWGGGNGNPPNGWGFL